MTRLFLDVLCRRLVKYRYTLFLCIFLLLADSSGAEENPPAEADQIASYSQVKTGEVPVIDLDSGLTLLIFPPGDIYPHYIADPHRVGFGVQRLQFIESGIADSGTSRYKLKAGGRLGLVRGYPQSRPDRGWQVSLEAGLDAQFDTERSYDNIGWDGNAGFLLTGTPGQGLALKVGMLHSSSHVGDEYIERTGRRRIDYTRHEFVAGISLAADEHWRTYAEAGWGYYLRNEAVQEPGRIQIGMEFESGRSLWKELLGWYAALDISAMEEREWRVDTSLQLGIMLGSGGRTWRLGIEYYDGRPTMGEFFQDNESYVSLGLWLDV